MIGRKLLCAAVSAGIALLSANAASAQQRTSFSLFSHSVGAETTVQCFEGLCVSLYVKRINVNGDRSEICAEFGNEDGGDWIGAYRLTQRDDYTTFASLRVASGDTRERCEILPQSSRYWVVLRQDS
jgi:hypothetical protein